MKLKSFFRDNDFRSLAHIGELVREGVVVVPSLCVILKDYVALSHMVLICDTL